MNAAQPLAGKVALVAGATRGAGRAIAIELALAGAKVYCTGRSSRAQPGSRPETIEETAEIIVALGGDAVAARVDHSRADEVAAFVQSIAEARVDILVNDIWGADAMMEWGVPLAATSLDVGFAILRQAIDTHIITSHRVLPLMGPGGLVIEVTDGAGFFYRGSFFYDLVKTTVIRMAFGLAEELRPRGIHALAITPGFLRSEAMLDHFGVTEETWRDAIAKERHFAISETPRYVARGIARLAADPELASFSGQGLASWHLMRRYGFTDLDGAQPDWGKHAEGEDFGRDQAASHARFTMMFPPL